MGRSQTTITKRLREKAKMEKRRRKAERAAERAAEAEEKAEEAEELPNDVDPDIAHIEPGPQKPIWEYDEFGNPSQSPGNRNR